MYKKGFSTVITGAIILFLITILVTYFIVYLNSEVTTISNISRETKIDIAREKESLRVVKSPGLIKIINDGSEDVKIKGIFVEYDDGDVQFIDLPLIIRRGDYYIYDTSSLGSYKRIYVLSESGNIYFPSPFINTSFLQNEIIITGNDTIVVRNPEVSSVLYIPNSTLYVSTSTRKYEIDLKKNEIIYAGVSNLYVSKNKQVIVVNNAVFRRGLIVYKFLSGLIKPVYIGWDYIVFQRENAYSSYHLDDKKLFLVSDNKSLYIGNRLLAGVSGDYIYYINQTFSRYNGKYLYTLYVIGDHYSNLKKYFLLLDFPIQQAEVFLNKNGVPIHLVDRFSPTENTEYYKEHNLESFICALKFHSYINGTPVYIKNQNNLLTSLSPTISNVFEVNGSINNGLMIWGVINSSAKQEIESTNETMISYKKLSNDYLIHNAIYSRFAFEKKSFNLIYPKIHSYYILKYYLKPSNVSIVISLERKFLNHYSSGTLKVSMSSMLSIYINESDGLKDIFSNVITTGDVSFNNLGSCHQAHYIELLFGFSRDNVLLYLSVYKSFDIASFKSGVILKEKVYKEYLPQLIFNRTFSFKAKVSRVLLTISNYTKIDPGSGNDLYTDYVSFPLLSVSSSDSSTYPEDYLVYSRVVKRLPNLYSIVTPLTILYYPSKNPISYSGWDYAYIEPPHYLFRCGWGYTIVFKFKESNRFYSSFIFSLNNFTSKSLVDVVNYVGIWKDELTVYKNTFKYIGSFPNLTDYSVISTQRLLIFIVPTGFGYKIIFKKL